MRKIILVGAIAIIGVLGLKATEEKPKYESFRTGRDFYEYIVNNELVKKDEEELKFYLENAKEHLVFLNRRMENSSNSISYSEAETQTERAIYWLENALAKK